MQIDLNTPLLDLDKNLLRVGPAADADPADLRKVIVQALLQPLAEDGQAPTGTAYQLYDLAYCCNGGGEVSLTAGEIELIKQRVEKIYAPMIVGPVWDALEGVKRTPS